MGLPFLEAENIASESKIPWPHREFFLTAQLVLRYSALVVPRWWHVPSASRRKALPVLATGLKGGSDRLSFSRRQLYVRVWS